MSVHEGKSFMMGLKPLKDEEKSVVYLHHIRCNKKTPQNQETDLLKMLKRVLTFPQPHFSSHNCEKGDFYCV